jgi:hypothetical protein
MRVAIEEQLGEVLMQREPDGRWGNAHGASEWFSSVLGGRSDASSPPHSVDDEMRVGAALGRPRAVFQNLAMAARDWRRTALGHELLTYGEARETIAQLGEIQLVVESILSDEWENWGDPRAWRGAERKPEQCVPVGSVYGTSTALNHQRGNFEQEHGLETFEGAWWYVPPPSPVSGGG